MKNIPIRLINFYLYTLLLIATPFLLLRNYMQNALGQFSALKFHLLGIHMPVSVTIAALLLAIFLFKSYKSLTKIKVIALFVISFFFITGQLTADFYFGHHFYDLQHNWHYIAYGIFSYIAYRRLSLKPRPIQSYLVRIFLMALSISFFDEFIQVFISNRVFDISDIAKDMWGNMAGTVFVFFFVEEGRGFPNFKFIQTKAKDYFRNPFSLLILEIIFTYIFLFVSAQFTESIYFFKASIITLLLCAFAYAIIFLLRNKLIRWIIGASAVTVVFYFLYAFHAPGGITCKSNSDISYKGIPLKVFDFLIYPNGVLRTVDKKTLFNLRDKQTLENIGPDILLIGTGLKNSGGKGWKDNKTTEIIYNSFKQKVYQIIKQPNFEACKTYNRLINNKKNVLFIIHTE